ncbi:endochitinase-like [Anopheles ziemanni]|uniref:endochitinase-like n=1 Tax=Anopheles ziemanni TaxID=345580 RepID=UPI00265FA999|nr:endochitinase-like [Anopheles ziemanni]
MCLLKSISTNTLPIAEVPEANDSNDDGDDYGSADDNGPELLGMALWVDQYDAGPDPDDIRRRYVDSFPGTMARDQTALFSPLNSNTVESGELGDVSIKDSLQRWLNAGCPKNKIILGINYGALTFKLEDPTNIGLGAPISGYGEFCPLLGGEGVCPYFELCQKFVLCHKTGWTFKWDEDGTSPYAFQGDQWFSYENATSIELKAAFARTKGLGGVLALNLAFDDYRVLCLVLLLAIGVCVESSPEGRVECIYSSSNQKRPGTYSLQIEDIPTEYCTHVIYDHITFEHSSMTIIPSNPEYDVVQNGWEKFIDLKKANPKLKLLMYVDRASFFIETDELRKEFIDAIVAFLTAYKFDGVTFRWFGYWNREGEESGILYTFFEELHRSFKAAGHPEWEANIMLLIGEHGIDHARLCGVADSVSLIPAFDSSNSHTYLMAPLNNSTFKASDVQDVSITHSVQKWLKNGCPANKMILGVPFVVATFTLEDPANNGVYARVSGSGNPCSVTGNAGNCAYFELCQKFNETEWTFKWDEDGACPYAFQDISDDQSTATSSNPVPSAEAISVGTSRQTKSLISTGICSIRNNANSKTSV